jgi:hypothetical protein
MGGTNWRARARAGGHWTEAEAREALTAWEASGASLSAFARQSGFHARRLSWWRKRFETSVSEERAPSFVPVTVKSAPVVSLAGAAITVRLGEVCVEVEDPSRVPAVWVVEVLQSLSGRRR